MPTLSLSKNQGSRAGTRDIYHNGQAHASWLVQPLFQPPGLNLSPPVCAFPQKPGKSVNSEGFRPSSARFLARSSNGFLFQVLVLTVLFAFVRLPVCEKGDGHVLGRSGT